MEHSYFKDRISAYHDNELKHEERQAIEDHLAECAECRQLLEQLGKLDAMVEKRSGLKDDEYWEQSARRIEQALGAEKATSTVTTVAPSAYKGLWWKVAGIAASVAVIAFIALYETDITREAQQAIEMKIVADTPPEPGDDTVVSEGFVPQPAVEKPSESKLTQEPKQETELDELLDRDEPTKRRTVYKDTESAQTDPTVVVDYADNVVPATKESPGRDNLIAEAEKTTPDLQAVADSVLAEIEDDTDYFSELGAVVSPSESKGEAQDAVTNKEGEVFVRGGSAAEVAYIALPEEPVSDERNLDYWRSKRDSLVAVLPTRKLAAIAVVTEEAIKSTSLAAKSKKILADSTAETETVHNEVEIQLLECLFRIAELTPDENERAASVTALKQYAESDDPELKALASVYLTQLETGQ